VSYREGFEWVVQHYDPQGTRKIMVKTCSSDQAIDYYRKRWHAERFMTARTPQAAEVFMDLTRAKCRKGARRRHPQHRARARSPVAYSASGAALSGPSCVEAARRLGPMDDCNT
jgi:hypothetical protein